MPVILTLPDDIAKKLQRSADARQQSINDCAIGFLERALEGESFDTQSDFKMLGAQIRATATPSAPDLSKEPSETKATHNDNTSDFEKIGDKIKSSPPKRGGDEARERGSEGQMEQEGDGDGEGATLSSASSPLLDENSNQNHSDFKKLGTQIKGRAAAIASTGWLLDPSVSPINDHKYHIDLEQWRRMWANVKTEMTYGPSPS